jgi:hypothetical protein
MEGRPYSEIAKEEVNFLKTSFGCKLVKRRKHNWGYELCYVNSTTGVKIMYEYREAYIFFSLGRLINGKLVESIIAMDDKGVFYNSSLDDIIALRNPGAMMKPGWFYDDSSKCGDKENGFTLFVKAFAANLEKYAADVLNGDFEIFKDTSEIVKQRMEARPL